MKLYITVDNIGIKSGGGTVTANELIAMKSLNDDVISIDINDINPINIGLPDTPFLQDYLTLQNISHVDLEKVDIAHFYSGCFTQTIRLLKSKGIMTTYTCAAHDRKISINEFERLGYVYPYSHVKDDRLWPMYFGGVRETDVVIAPSKSSSNFLYREGCKRVEIIPHGCNIPEKVEPISNQFNVGYLGGLGPDKGVRYFIESWSKLGYKDSTLIFAGRYTEQLGSFINKFANKGLFHIMGYVNDVRQLYDNISIYVQPSVTEGFGLEVLEAMSYGRPVIISEGCGAKDVVTESIDGFIVSKRDPKAIAEKIDWFKNHPQELIEMGKAAREKAKQFNWNIIKDKYANLWKSILNE